MAIKPPPIQTAPPHSPEAEMGVIGSILIDPKVVIPECNLAITPDFFYLPTHQMIYEAILEMWSSGIPIDLLTVTQHMRDKGLLDAVGGASYVTSLFTFVPTAANVLYYLDILTDKYVLRQIIPACTEAVRRCYEEQDEVPALLEEVKEKIAAINPYKVNERKTLKELVEDKMGRMELGNDNDDVVYTGITKLDEGSPLRNGDMPILSGETKSGKTMLAVTIAKNVATQGIGVGIFSLESTVHELVDRLLAGTVRISMEKLRKSSNLDTIEISKVAKSSAELSSLPIYLYDDLYDLNHIIAEGRRLKTQNDVGLLIIDYAQLVKVRVQKDRNREQEVASISRAIRLMALQLHIPTILLCQLNEEGRSRESRAIEQDCTAHWMIERIKDGDRLNDGLRKIYVPFQRNAAPCDLTVTFLGNIGRMENFTPEDHITVPSVAADRRSHSYGHLNVFGSDRCKTEHSHYE